jgi:hypothetical protein
MAGNYLCMLKTSSATKWLCSTLVGAHNTQVRFTLAVKELTGVEIVHGNV